MPTTTTKQTDWIMTASGKPFWPLEPDADAIDINDIAHALAAVNRFNGHTREPYSVAQHSVLVSKAMEEIYAPEDMRWVFGLYGLLHDASEAYLCDVPRPLKRLEAFAAYRNAEGTLQAAIYSTFGLTGIEPDVLKTVDRRMLRTEQAYLMPPPALNENRRDVAPFPMVIRPWSAAFAKQSFLNRFNEIHLLRSRTA